jgi:hypothetical protein
VNSKCLIIALFFLLSKDVLLGRGRNHFFHPGNRQFREVVGMNYGAYLYAETKSQKSIIVNKIVNEALAPGARISGTRQQFEIMVRALGLSVSETR